jgi:hypothetical protein
MKDAEGNDIMIDVVNGEDTINVLMPDGLKTDAMVAADYMPKNTFQSELGRRAVGIAEGKGYRKPEDMLSDEDHVATIMEKHQLVKKGSKAEGEPKPPTPEMIAELQGEWRTKELVPVQESQVAGEKRIDTLLGRMKSADIVAAAAAAGVKERFLNAVATGQDAPIVSMLGSVFGFDEELGEHFVRKDKDQFEITSDPKSTHPYKTIREFVTNWAGLPDNKDFVDVATQTGARLKDAPGTVSGKNVTINREQASDAGEYEKARVEAEKRGGIVVVSGTPQYGAMPSG